MEHLHEMQLDETGELSVTLYYDADADLRVGRIGRAEFARAAIAKATGEASHGE